MNIRQIVIAVGLSLVSLIGLAVDAPRPAAGSALAVQQRGEAIDAILYSDASVETMLSSLEPLISNLRTLADFEANVGGLSFEVGSGPGIATRTVPFSGLLLTFDSTGALRWIGRGARTVNGHEYEAMSLGDRGFEDSGYYQWHGN